MPAGLQEEWESSAENSALAQTVQEKGQMHCISTFQKFQEAPQSRKEQRKEKADETKEAGKCESVEELWNCQTEGENQTNSVPLHALELWNCQTEGKKHTNKQSVPLHALNLIGNHQKNRILLATQKFSPHLLIIYFIKIRGRCLLALKDKRITENN